MKNNFFAIVSVILFLSACSSKNSNAPADLPQPTPSKNYAPPGSLTLDGGDAELTYADQEVNLNKLSETSPGRIGLFYKVFELKSDRDLTIALDQSTSNSENCQKEVEPGIEIEITEGDNKVADLKNKTPVDIKAGILYKIRLNFTNFGACEKVNYVFGLLAYEINTQKLATAPSPKLAANVGCLAQDQSGTDKEILFNFKMGQPERPEIWMKNPGSVGTQFLYSKFDACGMDYSLITCDSKFSFDGSNFKRSLSCTADNMPASSGETFFNLETGTGHLNCQSANGKKSYDLVLSSCRTQQ